MKTRNTVLGIALGLLLVGAGGIVTPLVTGAYASSHAPEEKTTTKSAERSTTKPEASLTFTNPLKFKTFQSLSDVVLGNAWKVAMPFAIAFYLYAGYLYLTAFGKPDKVKQANSIFIYTSAGYGVIVLAHVIPVLIEGILNGIGAVL